MEQRFIEIICRNTRVREAVPMKLCGTGPLCPATVGCFYHLGEGLVNLLSFMSFPAFMSVGLSFLWEGYFNLE